MDCIDCGKTLHSLSKYQGSKRCKSCVKKYQYATRPETSSFFGKKGKLSYNFKGGKPHCEDCGRELVEYDAKLCKSCYYKTLRGKGNPMYGVHRFGKEAPTWIDGRSFEPYTIDFNNNLKELIRKRDNYTCQNCGMTEEEHIIIRGRVLDVHHIDYNKQNCNEDNLIVLCNQCNVRANYNKDYWQEFYTNKILENIK